MGTQYTVTEPENDSSPTFAAPTRFDKLFSGIVVERPAFIASWKGAEHIGPEDTFDADYGRLLERACVPPAVSPVAGSVKG